MDFQFWSEIKIVRKIVKHVSGPCLLCDQKTEYSARIGRVMQKPEWLDKYFEPAERRRCIRYIRAGAVPVNGRSLATLEALLCIACLTDLPTTREKYSAERQAKASATLEALLR